ncbi:hypothetical protein [Metabacillus halosaccharovorans]|uniref:hypothetical protein n=1 Tax=Metabacillus halosaccharovorans TaxID=930124 RepID=UPI001C1F676F|nr:hypothetical protein [Metabacillus halosaccharovorans]
MFGCSTNEQTDEEKDILFVRLNLGDFHAETTPYQHKIEFTLKTEEIINGLDEPIKIASIYDTDVDVTEVRERENELKGEKEIIVNVGFDGHFKQEGGTMLATFSLNDDGTHRTGSVEFEAFDDNGVSGEYGGGAEDYEGQYQQHVHYNFEKDEFMKSNEWTFVISGLHLLKYNKK